MDKIFIILVNYNNPQLTIDCVDSIKKSTYTNYSIVIVDNASTDNSFEVLTKNYKNDSLIYLIKSNENNGFSAGNNIGIKFALERDAEYVMLLNNDTVIDKDMISSLLLKADENIVTVPKMFYYSKPSIVWYAGGEINRNNGRIYHIGINKEDSKEYSNEINCSFATGCCLLVHKKIVEKVGFLDESFFLYCEDADYSLRLSQNNITIRFIPKAILWHKVGSSSSSSKVGTYYNTRNMLFLLDRYGFSIVGKIRFRIKILLLMIKKIIFRDDFQDLLSAYKDYKNAVIGKTSQHS